MPKIFRRGKISENGGLMIKLFSVMFCFLFFCNYCFAEKLILSDSIRIAREQAAQKTSSDVAKSTDNDIAGKGQFKAHDSVRENEVIGKNACSISELKSNPEEASCSSPDTKQLMEEMKKTKN